MLTIESMMNKNMVTADLDETVQAAAQRMKQGGVGAVIVLEGKAIAGLFTERDLLTRVVAEGRDPAATSVGEVATREVVTVTSETSIRVCADVLKTNHVRHLPVLDGRQPIGIVSARDFFESVAEKLEGLIDRVRYDEQLRDDSDPYDHIGGGYGR